MKFRFIGFVLICLFARPGVVLCQNQYSLPQITPQSPNTASLGKYGEIPVSLSNGMANVSIPLFNLKAGSYNVPVTLTYHNNGLKNDELASYAGLGWDIQAGGIISCEQRGNYDFDESGNGMFTTSPGTNPGSVAALNKYLAGQMSVDEAYNWMESVIRGDMDSEYDLYHYDFAGHTGNFYFDGNQNIVCVPKCDLKITRDADGFTILDENGNQYGFFYAEASTMSPPEGQVAPRKSFHSTASFLLGRIVTAEGRSFGFGYASYPMTYSRTSWSYGVTGAQPYSDCPGNSMTPSLMIYTLDNNLLTQIDYDEGTVYFDLSTDMRQDLQTINTSINVPYLTGIRLVDKKNKVRDFWSLSSSNDPGRLMLNSVTRTNGTAPAEKWSFDYYSTSGMSPYFDMQKDHWGYSNGAPRGTNTLSIPLANYSKATNGVWISGDQGMFVDRTADFGHAVNGVLHHITYPTGGQTEFNYERNQINFAHASDLSDNPFLTTSPFSYGHTEYLVSATTDQGDVVTGTFTLATAQTVYIIAQRDVNGLDFINSLATMNHIEDPNAVPDLLSLPFQGSWVQSVDSYIQERYLDLPAGTYTYTLIKNAAEGNTDGGGHAGLSISRFVEDDPQVVYPVGGCRISSVVSNDGMGNTTTKRYVYQDASDKVIFRNIPNYVSVSNVHKNVSSGGTGIIICAQCNPAYIAHDESVVPFAGNSIEYQYVTEYTDETGANGKTDYTFSADDDYTGITGAPHLPRWVTTWRGGLPIDKKVYKNEGGNYIQLSKESTAYEVITPSQIKGLMIEYWIYCDEQGPQYRQMATGQEAYINETFHPLSSTKATYDNSGNISTTLSSTYASTAHTMPTAQSQTDSKNRPIRQQIKYSFDYNVTSGTDDASAGIRNLQQKNVLIPVENLAILTINNVDYVTDGTLTIFKTNATVPAAIYHLSLTSPVALSAFTISAVGTGGTFTMDSHYEKKAELNAYDQFNNILQYRYSDNVFSSFIWDYNQLHLIAQVTGATQQDIAYTSFEADGSGGWTVGSSSKQTGGVTGGSCYPAASDLSKTGLNSSTTYVVSYWSDNNSALSIPGTVSGYPVKGRSITINGIKWNYYEHKVTGQSTINLNGNGKIDELRLYPATAQMTTYTYTPLVGISSQCDPRNRISYYEYDELNRLRDIKDLDGNVIKTMEYHFKGQ